MKNNSSLTLGIVLLTLGIASGWAPFGFDTLTVAHLDVQPSAQLIDVIGAFLLR